jgi:2',3'-cyclic-nucleotide 2'-phosphodiesterase (5'-nucleotidase family)
MRTAGSATPPQVGTSAPDVDLVVAATTDVHGRLRSWDYYADAPEPVRGLTRAATIVDSLRADAPDRLLLVDAGDLLQGNPLTYVAARMAGDSLRPHPVAAAMNVMRYDAAAIGNHEFNYGVPTLRRMIGDAHFPMLAANAFTTSGKHAFPSWTMVRRAGVKVGIVGATTPGSNLWDRENLAAAHLVIRDIVPAVREAVGEVRRAGADVVIVLLHSGLNEASSYDTVSTHVASENVSARVAHEVPGIDLIVFGHSHKELADTIIGGTLLMQPKNWATSVGVAHLHLVPDGARWRVADKRSTLVRAAGHPEDAAVLAATEKAHRATVAYVTTPIGTTPVAWRADSARVVDTPLMDFILEVERKAASAQLASTAAFSLDANLAAGPVTVARLAALYPYDNTLRKIWITGRQLRDYLEFSARYFRVDGSGRVGVDPSIPGYNFDMVAGADYTIDVTKPIGSRITSLQYRGKPIAPTDSFTFALNNYRQTGGGGYAMLAGSHNLDDRQLEIRQLLIDEVRARKTLRPEDYAHRNWALVPDDAAGQAYAAMHRMPREGDPGRPVAPVVGPRLRLIGTNDIHGALEPRPDDAGVTRGGLAYVAGAIERAEHECAAPGCTWLLLDGGDEFQGTAASNLAFGRPVVEIFNHLGLAAAALGNHEFDWGQDTLRARMRQAHYDVLGANVRDTLGRPVSWIPADTLIVRGADRIGVIGVSTLSTPTSTRASNTVGLRFMDPAPIVDSLTRTLRARGANAVVVVAHAGAFCDRTGAGNCSGEIVDLAQHLTEHVDAIVSGHTHSLINATINGIPIVQGRSRGQAIDVIDLPMGTSHGAPVTHEVRDVLPDSIVPDTVVQRIVSAAVNAVAPLVSQPVARIAEPMKKSASGAEEQVPLGNLIADAMRVEGNGDLGVMNNGGIRAALRAGTATYGDLFEVQPFGNILYRVTVDGRDLRAYIERLVARRRPSVHLSGAVVEYDTARAAGARLVAVQVGGAPLVDDRSYTVVLNDFEYTGGSGLGFPSGAVRRAENLNLGDLDAFVAYLRASPQPVEPPNDRRFIIVPAP